MNNIDFNIVQDGKALSCLEGKVVINKYENKVTVIHFDFDESIYNPESLDERPYFALLNPVTEKYSYYPILDGLITITSGITAYPGAWKAILVIVGEDYEIVDDDLDQTKVTFVSDMFTKFVVKDNFLSESSLEPIPDPLAITIDKALDDLMKARNELEKAAEDATEAKIISTENKDIVVEAEKHVEQMETHVEDMKNAVDDMAKDTANIYEKIKVSETNAKTSETNAKTSETNAKTAETNVALMESNVKNISDQVTAKGVEISKNIQDEWLAADSKVNKAVNDANAVITTATEMLDDVESAVAQAEKVNAEIANSTVDGYDLTITNKNGVSKTVTITNGKDGKDYEHSEEFSQLAAQVHEDADRTEGYLEEIDAVATLELEDETKEVHLVTDADLKTINGESIIGEGDIIIKGGCSEEYVKNYVANTVAIKKQYDAPEDKEMPLITTEMTIKSQDAQFMPVAIISFENAIPLSVDKTKIKLEVSINKNAYIYEYYSGNRYACKIGFNTIYLSLEEDYDGYSMCYLDMAYFNHLATLHSMYVLYDNPYTIESRAVELLNDTLDFASKEYVINTLEELNHIVLKSEGGKKFKITVTEDGRIATEPVE